MSYKSLRKPRVVILSEYSTVYWNNKILAFSMGHGSWKDSMSPPRMLLSYCWYPTLIASIHFLSHYGESLWFHDSYDIKRMQQERDFNVCPINPTSSVLLSIQSDSCNLGYPGLRYVSSFSKPPLCKEIELSHIFKLRSKYLASSLLTVPRKKWTKWTRFWTSSQTPWLGQCMALFSSPLTVQVMPSLGFMYCVFSELPFVFHT